MDEGPEKDGVRDKLGFTGVSLLMPKLQSSTETETSGRGDKLLLTLDRILIWAESPPEISNAIAWREGRGIMQSIYQHKTTSNFESLINLVSLSVTL